MAIFDERVIAPTEEELVAVLRKAMKSANRENRYQNNRIARDAAFWGRFARDVLRGGSEGRRRSCKGGWAVPEVIAGWWTDPAGRKHVRVVGRTRQRYARLRRETELRALPPWWHVYPEPVVGVHGKKEDEERYIAVCRCGAVGTPESLGWMGDTCGPCFDRRAEGGTAAGGYGQFGGWSAGSQACFGFTPDGRHLIGQNRLGVFWRVDRADGSVHLGARRTTAYALAAIGSTADGHTLVTQNGAVYRWPTGTADPVPALQSRPFWGRIALAPDCSRLILLGYQEALSADLTAARPKYTRVAPVEGAMAVKFTPDGSRVLMLHYSSTLYELHPDTLVPTPLRSDLFSDLSGPYGPPTDLAVSPDGRSILLRRERYYPRLVVVRHIPLDGGKAVTLRVPDWHRPTSQTYSPDGKLALTAEADTGWVGFWDLANGKALGFVRAVTEDVAWRSGSIEFAPDGRALAVSYNSSQHDRGTTVAVWPWPDILRALGE